MGTMEGLVTTETRTLTPERHPARTDDRSGVKRLLTDRDVLPGGHMAALAPMLADRGARAIAEHRATEAASICPAGAHPGSAPRDQEPRPVRLSRLLAVTTAIAVLAAAAHAQPPGRKTALYEVLGQAVMLHASVSRHADLDPLIEDSKEGASAEISIDLAQMELLGGYLETCVYEPGKVRALRFVVAYGRVLKCLGYSDAEVKEVLVRQAGERAGELEQLLDYAGLEGIPHFICLDYLRGRLHDGMTAEELREYIDAIPGP